MPPANNRPTAEIARAVGIVGVPMDLGAGRRGVDMGPFAIRYAGLEHEDEKGEYRHRAVEHRP